jgi:hypothetical protein
LYVLEAALKHAAEFELIPHIVNIIFRSTPYPIAYLRQVAYSSTPLSKQAKRMIKEDDGTSVYALPIHSPQSLASVLEVLGKLIQSSDYHCQFSLYSNYGIYVLLNLASIYVMEIRKGGNHRLYSGTEENIYDTSKSLYSSPKKRSNSPSKLPNQFGGVVRDKSPSLEIIYPSFPYVFLIPSLCLTCISSLCVGSLVAQKQFVRLGGVAVGLAALNCSTVVRRNPENSRVAEEGDSDEEEKESEDGEQDVCVVCIYV